MPASSSHAAPRPTRTDPVPLSTLARDVGVVVGVVDGTDVADISVTGVTAASALVRPGDLFAALPGRTTHGVVYADDAIARGAVAVLTDAAGSARLGTDVARIVVDDVRAALGEVSARVYGHPAAHLRLYGVTGTSGKTTTTFLIRAGLRAAGISSGLLGTVATMIGEDVLASGFTTPEAPELHALLAVMRERGVQSVAMEVSSHAVAMHRTDGIEFAVGGFTNLSEDHLDFHADMEDYFSVKFRFMAEQSTRAVAVVDDEWGRRVVADLPGTVSVRSVSTHGGSAEVQAVDIRQVEGGTTTFALRGPWGVQPLGCAIPGRYNVANVALAWTMLYDHGVTGPAVAEAISTAQVPGRMERIEAGQPFLAVVDYSHKPAAVAGAIEALRPLTSGTLLVVLGSGGDRDRGKRPHMGEIAARGADVLIVTDDNPRSEDPATIRAAMLAGAESVPAGERGEVVEIGDRAAAIAEAVRRAGPGDTVLVAGKGHETGQEVAGVVHPFDDRVVLREAVEK